MGNSEGTADWVLVVDDEQDILESLHFVLLSSGIPQVIKVADSRKVMATLAEKQVGVVLLDLTMPYLPGQELLPLIRQEHPEIPVIVVTGSTDISVAVECMKLGAFDYLVKAIEGTKLIASVRRALEIRSLERANADLKRRFLSARLEHPEAFMEVISRDPAMRSLFIYLESIAPTAETVLLMGETGTGKELLARAVHELSGRTGLMVTINVAGLDDAMFSDTLFGHRKGAFTGAMDSRAGLVEKAAGGTMLLDEIGDLNVASQIKLLRLLEAHEYYPLGADAPRKSTARIVAATNQDLRQAIDAGRFRRDLYYRLATCEVRIPPLRERMDDLPLLVDHFVEKTCADLGRPRPAVPEELFVLCARYDFPGNIRELRSLVSGAISAWRTTDLPLEGFRRLSGIAAAEKPSPAAGGEAPPLGRAAGVVPVPAEKTRPPADLPFSRQGPLPSLQEADAILIAEAMRRAGGNQSEAARLLGISQSALSRRLARLASHEQE